MAKPAQGDLNHASKDGIVKLVISLHPRFEEDAARDELQRILDDIGNYGDIVRHSPWDLAVVSVRCPLGKASELIHKYDPDKNEDVSGIETSEKCFFPCY